MEINQDEYLKLVVERDDKPIFREALECASHGSLRAAYIMIWVAIIESLKRKLYILKAHEFTSAKDAITKIEDIENKKGSTDREIFDQSHKCGIVDLEQLSSLSYIWERRCVFAHPYERSPGTSDILHAIDKAIEITLGAGLYYNRPAIEDKILTIASQPHIINNNDEEVQMYIDSFIKRIKAIDYLHAYAFAVNQVKLWLEIKESDIWILRRLRTLTVSLAAQPSVNFENERWNFDLSIEKYCYLTWITVVDTKTWQKFSPSMQEKLINFITLDNLDGKRVTIYDLLHRIHPMITKHSKLNRKVLEFYDSISFLRVVSIQVYPFYLYRRILNQLSKVSYPEQNEALSFLNTKQGISLLLSLLPSECVNIGIFVTNLRVRSNNWKADDIPNKIATGKIEFPEYFICGIVLGYFVRTNNSLAILPFQKSYFEFLNFVGEEVQTFFSQKMSELIDSTPDTLFCPMATSINSYLEIDLTTIAIAEPAINILKMLIHQFDAKIQHCLN